VVLWKRFGDTTNGEPEASGVHGPRTLASVQAGRTCISNELDDHVNIECFSGVAGDLAAIFSVCVRPFVPFILAPDQISSEASVEG